MYLSILTSGFFYNYKLEGLGEDRTGVEGWFLRDFVLVEEGPCNV